MLEKLLLPFAALLLLASCSSDMREKLEPEPVAFGPLNQLNVVTDEEIWSSIVGDTFDYYFASAYPILPQPEPIYDLRHFTPEEFFQKPERRRLRRYVILADLNDTESETTKLVYRDIDEETIEEARTGDQFKTAIATDRWAKGQLVVYMFGYGHDRLIENIQTNFQGINKRIRQSESAQIAAKVYPGGTNGSLMQTLKDTLGVSVKIPSDFYLAMYDEEAKVAWIRQERTVQGSVINTNIMFRRLAYEDQQQLQPEYVKTLINNLGQYVSSEIDNTYLVVNDQDLPMVADAFQRSNRYTLQLRGIWEMANDFMGGPFVAEMTLDPNTNDLLLSFGFIFAPSEDKRDYMKYLEHIMATTQLEE